jgi:hypothetical protein
LPEDDIVFKQENKEAMDDATPSDARDLPLEYQAVLAARYDEKALLQQVLEASKADKDVAFLDLQEAIALTRMVAEHMASRPRPSPLRVHAPPQAAYDWQEVPPPPRRCRQDHPHRVVINPP